MQQPWKKEMSFLEFKSWSPEEKGIISQQYLTESEMPMEKSSVIAMLPR